MKSSKNIEAIKIWRILDLIKLEVTTGESWVQSNGEQSWEMSPPQILNIVGKKEATKELERLLLEARVEELDRFVEWNGLNRDKWIEAGAAIAEYYHNRLTKLNKQRIKL